MINVPAAYAQLTLEVAAAYLNFLTRLRPRDAQPTLTEALHEHRKLQHIHPLHHAAEEAQEGVEGMEGPSAVLVYDYQGLFKLYSLSVVNDDQKRYGRLGAAVKLRDEDSRKAVCGKTARTV